MHRFLNIDVLCSRMHASSRRRGQAVVVRNQLEPKTQALHGTGKFTYTLGLQVPPQKVFGPSNPTPNTFLEGTWSPRDIDPQMNHPH